MPKAKATVGMSTKAASERTLIRLQYRIGAVDGKRHMLTKHCPLLHILNSPDKMPQADGYDGPA
jgi:hypothetical protein